MAILKCQEFAAGLLDIVKAFDPVPHGILVQSAHLKGYPLTLLRLCLAADRVQRTIGVEGVFSKCVIATPCITAGVGFAAFEHRLPMLDLMKILHQRWADILVATLYVDDLALALRGAANNVANTMTVIRNFAVSHLQGTLRMKVSEKKAAVAASKPAIAVAIANLVVPKLVRPVLHAKLLGSNTVGGTRRCTNQHRNRLNVFL